MNRDQGDLFAEDTAERNRPSDAQLQAIRTRLHAVLERMEAAATFYWRDPLDAVHEENRFEREAAMLGEEGTALWARFDTAMDRLFETQFDAEGRRIATG